MKSSRRGFLLGGLGLAAGGALTAMGLPRMFGRALAASGPRGGGGRRFVFVVNRGGWDPLTALAPMFGRSQIALGPGASAATAHGIPFVDHAQRPSVRAFLEAYGGSTVVLQGISVRSVSHEVCEKTMLTGAATGADADFATRLAAGGADVALPHLVLAGPTFPGTYGSSVARAGATGQLQGLVDGEIIASSDVPVPRLSAPSRRLVEDFVARRTAAWRDASPGSAAHEAMYDALRRSERLTDVGFDVSFASDGSLASQVDVAVAALSRGVARCVTVSPPVSWDTHTSSDQQQSQLWEALFAGLSRLAARLETAPRPGQGGVLADDTVVVVMSEMGRTPQLNADQGRDHWPWTVAMLFGPGLTGGRVVGGFDDGYSGLGVDPTTGEVDAARAGTSPAQLGATLLQLADLDPGLAGPGVEALAGMLA